MDSNIRSFIPTLKENQLVDYLNKQLDSFFPDGNNNIKILKGIVNKSLERVEFCFSKIKGKYYSDDKNVFFNHLNGDHYCMFLYFASREAYLIENENYYLKLSLLNKHLFAIDIFGHIEMPNIFLLVHPIGTIIGRAQIKDYFIAYQGVTIGGVHKENGVSYPELDEGSICYSNSSILGSSTIAKNTIIGANTNIIGGSFKENSVILGSHPSIKIIDNLRNNKSTFFR
jgi:serine O-acetyltransferase